MMRDFCFIVSHCNVDFSHRLCFPDKEFLHITVIKFVLCVCSVLTDLVWPTKLLLLVILGGQVETAQRLGK